MKKLLTLLAVLCLFSPAGAFTAEEAETEHLRETQRYERRVFKQIKSEVKAGYTDSVSRLAELYYHGRGTKKNYKKAYKYFKRASHYHAYAAYACSFMLMRGQGVKADEAKALSQFLTQAQDGSALAAWELYLAYTYGRGTVADPAQAQHWLEQAVAKQLPQALLEKGRQLQSNDPQAAFKLFKGAAEQEEPAAQYEVARCFENGLGTERRPMRAFSYMLRAAKQNFAPAQWQVSQWYAHGYARVLQSASQAFIWAWRASRQDFKPAQAFVAECYEKGLGTEENPRQARYWKKSFQTVSAPQEELR